MTIPTVIYVPKDFYLIDAMNELIEDFKSAGLIQYWHFKSVIKKDMIVRDSKHPKVIKMHHLAGCFQLWIFGLFLGFVTFIVEVLSKKYFDKYL